MPETPSWLMHHENESEAREALQKLRGKWVAVWFFLITCCLCCVRRKKLTRNFNRYTNVEEEFQRIKNHNTHNASDVNTSFFSALTSVAVMKPLFISMGLMFFQQFSGINAIIFYSASIFEEAGSSVDRFVSSITIGSVQLFCTMLSASLVLHTANNFPVQLSLLFIILTQGW